mgnify:CR=1 FL=1|jgi:hypothetical protein
MNLYCMETERGFRYWVTAEGNISKAFDPFTQEWVQPKNAAFSQQWKLAGFAPILPFGRVGAIQPAMELVDHDMRYQNGRGRYAAVDVDHGTMRLWSDRIVNFSLSREEI